MSVGRVTTGSFRHNHNQEDLNVHILKEVHAGNTSIPPQTQTVLPIQNFQRKFLLHYLFNINFIHIIPSHIFK